MDIVAKNMVLTSAFQDKLDSCLCWMSSVETCFSAFYFSFLFLFLNIGAQNKFQRGEMLSLHVTQECGLENVSRVSIDIRVSSKWVKFQFWMNPPFKRRAKNGIISFSLLLTEFGESLLKPSSAPHLAKGW